VSFQLFAAFFHTIWRGRTALRTSDLFDPRRTARSLRILGATSSIHLLDIGQLPGLIEEWLLRTVKPEEYLKLAARFRRHPV
jgi:hypothetical protein